MESGPLYPLLQNCARRRRIFLQSYAWMEQLTKIKSRLLQRPFHLDIKRHPDEQQIMEELNYLHDSPQEEALQYIRNNFRGKFMDVDACTELHVQVTRQKLRLASDIVTGYVRSCFARSKTGDDQLVRHMYRIFPVSELHLNYYSLDKLFLYVRKVAQDRGNTVDEFSRHFGKSLLELQGYLPAVQYRDVAKKVFGDATFLMGLSWQKVAVLLMTLANTVIGLIDHQGGIGSITEETLEKVETLKIVTSLTIEPFTNDIDNWDHLRAVDLNAVMESFEVGSTFHAEAIPEPYNSSFEDYIPQVNSPMFKGYILPPLPKLTTLAFAKLPGTTIKQKRDFFAGKGVHSLHQFDYFD